ncbi:MAG: hypothetical protein RSA89_03735 [Raoultibacter sp.]
MEILMALAASCTILAFLLDVFEFILKRMTKNKKRPLEQEL